MEKRKNLIITRAGAESLHRLWLSSSDVEPTFDLLVAAYHPAAMGTDTDHVWHLNVPGAKVSGWNKLFYKNPVLLEHYDRIALIDDDIEATTAALNKCFEAGAIHSLSIWQPSLSPNSYVTYAAPLANPLFELRFVNVIEMMCPFFSSPFLKSIVPLFGLGFESGIDLVWCSAANEQGGKCAIIDQAIVKHTRPVGKLKELNRFVGRNYESDIYECLDRFSMKWPSWVVTHAITARGKTIRSRLPLCLASAFPFLTVSSAPHGCFYDRIKIAADHLRHQISRPARMYPIIR